MAFSKVGQLKLAAQVLLFIMNIVVLAVSTKVNKFNEFFYVADLLPLAGSILTLITLFVILSLDFATQRSPIGPPLIEAGITGVLCILWLAFSSFSSSRYKYIPKNCNVISIANRPERAWCKDVNVLQGFMWLMFVLTLIFTLATLGYTFLQFKQGHRHIFTTPLSRYFPSSGDSTFAHNGALFNPAMYDNDPVLSGRMPTTHKETPDWYVNGNYGTRKMSAISEKDETRASGEGGEQRRSEYDGYEKSNPFERMPPVTVQAAAPVGGGFAGVGVRRNAKDAAALW